MSEEKNTLTDEGLNFLENALEYFFTDRILLEEALTHSSYAHEYGLPYNNERLEFLGDSILGFIVARTLYRIYPDSDEGELTRMRAELVRAESLYKKAVSLGISDLILHGNAMKTGELPKKIISNAMESVLGAICVDGGVDAAEKVIKKLFLSDSEEQVDSLDPKSKLQMWLQARGLSLPQYELISMTGPSHSPTFEVMSKINGIEHKAQDKTRKGAEAKVAALLLEDLKKHEAHFGSKHEK